MNFNSRRNYIKVRVKVTFSFISRPILDACQALYFVEKSIITHGEFQQIFMSSTTIYHSGSAMSSDFDGCY